MASFTVPHIICIASHLSTSFVCCVVLGSSIQIIIGCRSHRQHNINIMIVSLFLARYSLISLIVSRGKHSKLHAAHTIAVVWATPTFKSQFRMWSARVMRTIYTGCVCVARESESLMWMHSHKCISPKQQNQMDIRLWVPDWNFSI